MIRSLLRRAPVTRSSPRTVSSAPEANTVCVLGKEYRRDDMTNVTSSLLEKVGRELHNTKDHPINLLKKLIVHHFHKTYTNNAGNPLFTSIENIPPVVTTEQNFDSLCVAKDHISRSRSDSYYINSKTMLRTHTSAHQSDFIKMGLNRFLVTGDVYRRDEIDSTHYPIFHQMEGVRIYLRKNLLPQGRTMFEDGEETDEKQSRHTLETSKALELELKTTLERLVKYIFGEETQTRWNSCYFPFTHPSFELEILFRGEWVEMLGSGIMRQEILDDAGASFKTGWAFGLGLDRLSMLLFSIPDIRLLWSKDERFIEQFKHITLPMLTKENLNKRDFSFKPFSTFLPRCEDVAFWITPEFNENDFHELVRGTCGDIVEKVELIDSFENSKTGKVSCCYRLVYRSMDRAITKDEVDELHSKLRENIEKSLPVELR